MFDKLYEKANQGDKEALEEIVTRLQPLLVASIRRYYNMSQVYEDLMQMGNLRIIEAIGDYDPGRGVHFLGYVKTVLRYMYLDMHKGKRTDSLNEVGPDGETEVIDTLESETKGPEDMILDQEMRKEVQEALASLTERQRQVVSLYYLENLSIKDISKRLGITYRTIVNTKTAALEKMRKSL